MDWGSWRTEHRDPGLWEGGDSLSSWIPVDHRPTRCSLINSKCLKTFPRCFVFVFVFAARRNGGPGTRKSKHVPSLSVTAKVWRWQACISIRYTGLKDPLNISGERYQFCPRYCTKELVPKTLRSGKDSLRIAWVWERREDIKVGGNCLYSFLIQGIIPKKYVLSTDCQKNARQDPVVGRAVVRDHGENVKSRKEGWVGINQSSKGCSKPAGINFCRRSQIINISVSAGNTVWIAAIQLCWSRHKLNYKQCIKQWVWLCFNNFH